MFHFSHDFWQFPTQNIATPTVLVYGMRDSLVDIKVMKKALPDNTVAIGVRYPVYEPQTPC